MKRIFLHECSNYLKPIYDLNHSTIIKKNKVKNISSIPGKTRAKISFNKNKFETKILNKYFFCKHMEICRIKRYYFKKF